MLACTFFGHSDCPETIRPNLQAVLIDLIVNQNIEMFYVGNQGQFDAIVRNVQRDLKMDYPAINYAVVLAYMPGKKPEYDDYSDTMLPEGIEMVYPRYAISWRNDWMLRQSEYVVTYITRTWGGAAQYAAKAKRLKKNVINLHNGNQSSC